MKTPRLLILLALAGIAGVLAGCSQGNSGDSTAAVSTTPVGIDRFLLFPNPIVQAGGSFQTNTTAYAQAYYTAIDPSNQKDTLAKWQAANNIVVGATGPNDHTVVFRDVRDLGYGRRMSGHYEAGATGRIAFFVENYLVNVPGGGYTHTTWTPR